MNIREAMQAFKASLIQWLPYMRRVTNMDVSVESEDRDVLVFFKLENFDYQHRFTSLSVYGPVGTRPVRAHYKICRFVDQAILGALQAKKDSQQ